MGESRYLIDSNAVIDYLAAKIPASGMAFVDDVVNARANISVISKIEVLGFTAASDAEKLLVAFIGDAVVLGLTDAVVDQTIAIRKSIRIRLPDAIIAATALVHNFELISRNVSDFRHVHDLRIVNPYDV